MFICSDIAGATGDTYLHTPTISTSAMYKVVVAARNNAGTSAPILGPTGVFEPGYVARVSLTNSVLPSISGSPTVGQTLSSTLGTWLGMLSPIQGSFGGDAIRVQWERCVSATAGLLRYPQHAVRVLSGPDFQNALASYTLQAGDAGYWIRARVTAFRQGSTCTVCGNVTVWAVPVGPVAEGAADQLSDLGVAVSNVGPGKSLAKKVKDAQVALGANDVPGTCSILGAFISEVSTVRQEIPARHGGYLDLRRRSNQGSARLLLTSCSRHHVPTGWHCPPLSSSATAWRPQQRLGSEQSAACRRTTSVRH